MALTVVLFMGDSPVFGGTGLASGLLVGLWSLKMSDRHMYLSFLWTWTPLILTFLDVPSQFSIMSKDFGLIGTCSVEASSRLISQRSEIIEGLLGPLPGIDGTRPSSVPLTLPDTRERKTI